MHVTTFSMQPNVIYIYAPAIYGQETMRDELKKELPSKATIPQNINISHKIQFAISRLA
jgi:hypothetical protein